MKIIEAAAKAKGLAAVDVGRFGAPLPPEMRLQRSIRLRVTDTLGRIADHKITKLDELMPWRYAEASA